jgi:hypothetical protein
VFAFEVANSVIGRGGTCAVVKEIPGSKILRGPRFWSWFREDQFCEFEVNGRRFVIEEPFGDNSRYWIGPEPPVWCEQVDVVRRAFLEANAFTASARGSFRLWQRGSSKSQSSTRKIRPEADHEGG